MNLFTLFLFLPSFVKKSLKFINLQCLKLAPFPNEVHKNKSLKKRINRRIVFLVMLCC